MSDKDTEVLMVAAHQRGRAMGAVLFSHLESSARSAAHELYLREDLKDAYIAGVLGEIKRITNVNSY